MRQQKAFGEVVRNRGEHRIVAEKALGKPLPDGAVVHHIDGDRSNNANTNLVICQDNAYHTILHNRQRAYEATGNANAARCPQCRWWVVPEIDHKCKYAGTKKFAISVGRSAHDSTFRRPRA